MMDDLDNNSNDTNLEPINFFIEPETHKTREIEKSEWRTLFTPSEAFRWREVIKNIDGDLSFLPHANLLSVKSGIPGIENLTWRQVLTLSVDEWNDARLINVNDKRVAVSTAAMAVLGVLDSPERASVLLEGIPL